MGDYLDDDQFCPSCGVFGEALHRADDIVKHFRCLRCNHEWRVKYKTCIRFYIRSMAVARCDRPPEVWLINPAGNVAPGGPYCREHGEADAAEWSEPGEAWTTRPIEGEGDT